MGALPQPPCRAENISVFVVTGQSNARPQYATGIEAGLRASGLWDHVVIFNVQHSGNWLTSWVTGNSTNGYTPGTNYTNDLWADDGSSGLQQLINTYEAQGDTVTVEGFYWFQGESDTINSGARAAYAGRLIWMLTQLRDHYGPFDLMITLIDWNHDKTDQLIKDGYTPEGVEEVRDALTTVATQLGGAKLDSREYHRADLWHLSSNTDPQGYYGEVTDFGADQAGIMIKRASCPADLNHDGEINFFDISKYLQLYQTGCP